jgi:N6-adenosine-specific RNA methylase IME4
MTMKTYKPHPAALVMPPMKPAELSELKRSILERGQVHPAVLIDGKLLDGRNRQEAIRQLNAEKKTNLELKVVEWSGRGETAHGFVDATNDKRRHLTESQRAMIATRLLPVFRKEAKERQRAAAKSTNRKRKQPELFKTLSAPGRGASKEAARLAGGKVSARTVERAEFVRKADPALARKVFEGELTVKQAEKKIHRREQVAQVEAYVPPAGEFGLIVVDFPWLYDDGREGNDAARNGADYPRMSVAEICQFPIPAAADCLLACWITNSMLIDGAWDRVRYALGLSGFEPKQMRTWVKTEADGGPTTGLGKAFRNDTEHLILLERGTVVYRETGGDNDLPIMRTALSAPVGIGSAKPNRAYADLLAICPMRPALELFARPGSTRDGWVTSGSELAASPANGDSVLAQPATAPFEEAPASPADVAPFSQPGGLGTPVLDIPF